MSTQACASSGSMKLNASAPSPLPGGDLDRLAVRAGDPHRRMRLLAGLGDHVAARQRERLRRVARDTGRAPSCWRSARPPRATSPASVWRGCRSRAAPSGWRLRRCRSRRDRRRSGRAWRCPRRCAPDGCSSGSPGGCRDRAGCATCGRPRRRGTPPAPTSASTRRGSGARPPTRSRTRAGRRAPPDRARRGAAGTRRRRSTAWGADARRRRRTASGQLSRPSSAIP